MHSMLLAGLCLSVLRVRTTHLRGLKSDIFDEANCTFEISLLSKSRWISSWSRFCTASNWPPQWRQLPMVSSRLPSDLSLNIDLFYFSSFCFLYSTLLSTDTAISISHRLAQFLVSLPHIWSVSLDQRVWLYVHIPQFLGFQHFFVQWSYHFLVVFILTS